MAAKSKEEIQKEINEKRVIRNKQVAQLKAQNELLEEEKKRAMEKWGADSDKTKTLFRDIDFAISQNLDRGREFLGASEDEIKSVGYNEVDSAEVLEYNKRLERRGITDEELREKDLTKNDAYIELEESKSPIDKLKEKLSNLKNKKKVVESQPNDGLMSDEEFEELLKKPRPTPDYVFDGDNIKQVEKPKVNKADMEEATKTVEKDSEPLEKSDEPAKATVEYVESKPLDFSFDDEKRASCEDFDPRDIAPEVMYDIIELPSHGECYPHKKGKLPIAYLTAADENLIASPNMYNNGNLIDIILERKILDKTINVKDLCQGDRDAITVWLRATAYDKMFPIRARDPKTGKTYDTRVDLSKLKYKEFKLKGDENGYFDYKTSNGDIIKFKVLSKDENQKLLEYSLSRYGTINRSELKDRIANLKRYINELDFYDGYDSALEALEVVNDWTDTIKVEDDLTEEGVYTNAVTTRMIAHTKSINGETNPVYIKAYIENMRAGEAAKYRRYIDEHVPGMDLKIKFNIPESDGGGSFETFLGISDTIFITV